MAGYIPCRPPAQRLHPRESDGAPGGIGPPNPLRPVRAASPLVVAPHHAADLGLRRAGISGNDVPSTVGSVQSHGINRGAKLVPSDEHRLGFLAVLCPRPNAGRIVSESAASRMALCHTASPHRECLRTGLLGMVLLRRDLAARLIAPRRALASRPFKTLRSAPLSWSESCLPREWTGAPRRRLQRCQTQAPDV